MSFDGLKRGHYGAILADPPWRFQHWSGKGTARAADNHYDTVDNIGLAALPVSKLAAPDCALFVWISWPKLEESLSIINWWGFHYKTCAFAWTKAHANQLEMFQDQISDQMGMGYWTRANTEVCLLATRGQPKRLNADVRQAIIAPRREHSRKPDGIHERIERLVAGPYLELFARQRRPGWDVWGNEVDKFTQPDDYDATDDFARSIDEAYRVIRERKANGGKGWTPP